VSSDSSVLPNQSIEYESHGNCGGAESVSIKIDIREEEEIGNYKDIGNG
jgi:hypothetical protein